MTAKYDSKNPIALKQLVGSGTKLRPFSQDVMKHWIISAWSQRDSIYRNVPRTNCRRC